MIVYSLCFKSPSKKSNLEGRLSYAGKIMASEGFRDDEPDDRTPTPEMGIGQHSTTQGTRGFLVGGDWNMTFIFSFSWESSSQLTHIFQRGRYTTSQFFV